MLRPKVAKGGVEFSAGGQDRPFASLEREKGQSFSLDWPESLPKPVVTGDVATYGDAAGPGADLVVRALPTGFRHDVVLRSKPSGPTEFRLPVQTDGLKFSASTNGRLRLSDSSGKTIAQAPAPLMLDSSPQTASKDGKTPTQHRLGKISTRVITEAGKQILVLEPDAKFLADPATKYPVTVDPTTTLTLLSDTYVHSKPTYSWGGYDEPNATLLKVGGESTVRTSGDKAIEYYRALLKFDTAPIAGRAIGDARLDLWATETLGCNFWLNGLKVSRLTSAWQPGAVDWTHMPGVDETGSQLQLCPSNWSDPKPFTWSVTTIASSWAGGAPNHGLQIRGVNESMTWGQNGTALFHSAETTGTGAKPPKLTVTYMLPPEIPTVTAESIDSMDGMTRSPAARTSRSASSPAWPKGRSLTTRFRSTTPPWQPRRRCRPARRRTGSSMRRPEQSRPTPLDIICPPPSTVPRPTKSGNSVTA
ncbi:DNRLRE domain-containing protein [Sphaerisporangium sp. NPDC049002]|uniref:DNRLRE domain-containing protein n=1 Tax=Sphaerisporangium sp. NPDC049002 TaxID=3155392 RepID=UPI0033CB801A